VEVSGGEGQRLLGLGIFSKYVFGLEKLVLTLGAFSLVILTQGFSFLKNKEQIETD